MLRSGTYLDCVLVHFWIALDTIQTLKIDQSFIRDITENEEDTTVVKAIIALAKSLNMDVIAEGVETDKQLSFLLKNKCHNIQGYYYAKPMPADEMKIYMKKIL
ncbi:MAG TPA: EAL domain-containing protein [Sulfurospirillum arcachonense]|nr:EAL domain-containing protein [Sulfurospirillum arcachonense]